MIVTGLGAGARLRAKREALPTLPDAADALCWLRPDVGVTNQRGVQIHDLTGNGYNFSNGLATQAPVLTPNVMAGQPGLAFDGSNDVVLNGAIGGGQNLADALAGGSDKPFSAFFSIYVDSVPAEPAEARLFTVINSPNQTDGMFYLSYNDTDFSLFKRGSGVSTGILRGGGPLTPGYHLISLLHSGTSTKVRVDGVEVWDVATDVDTLVGLDVSVIGRSGAGSSGCHMKLLEFIAYDVELT